MVQRKPVHRARARTAKPAADARVRAVRARLAKAIPEPHCELDASSPWQLLVATILSAQSTDKQVNLVTPEAYQFHSRYYCRRCGVVGRLDAHGNLDPDGAGAAKVAW